MNLVTVSRISKKEGNDFVVKDISFHQQRFQRIAIAGETGSGKSTLLQIIAGLVQPDAGRVLFENQRVKGPEEVLIPGHPGIAYLPQDFELRNNYRMEELLQYANKLPGEKAQTVYEVCRIRHLLNRKNGQLSGGEKQRIAIARLLISSPTLLLLDEPFSNLDIIHKTILKSVINDLAEQLNITCLLVSHDPMDTLSWADEIMVMKDGQMIQKGSPWQIYHQPVNEYTAALFGGYNLIKPAEAVHFKELPGIIINDRNLFIRPENISITTPENPHITGTVNKVTYYGSYYDLQIMLLGKRILARTTKTTFEKGDTVCITVSPFDVWYI